jgi:hypothetical protein
VEDFSNNNIKPFQFSSAAGHYTHSDKVGCGATSYKDGRRFTTLYVFNYGPNGNFIKGQMYQQQGGILAVSLGPRLPGNHENSQEILAGTPSSCISSRIVVWFSCQ